MRKQKETQVGPYAVTGRVEAAPCVCGTCRYWDQNTFDPNEVLSNPHDPAEKHKVFACKLLPHVEWKQADDWCGQHEYDE